MSDTTCFLSETATQDLLNRVTDVCSECYATLEVGETIYYDMQQYRYLCSECQKKIAETMNEDCEVIPEQGGLF